MRFALFVVVGLIACKGEPFRPDAQVDGPPIDAYDPPWFYPQPGEVKNWDIQLVAPFDFATPRQMMIVDLWKVVPSSMMITYDDATMVTVPAGSDPTRIAALKGQGATVICYVGMGAAKLTDPDIMKFPGYEANPPNRPTPVAANSAIGWATSLTDASERFIDFRNTAAQSVLVKRIKFAKQIGCQGIAAYRNDVASFVDSAFTHGFSMISAFEQGAWIMKQASEGHAIEISVGQHGGHAVTGLDAVADDLDWIIADRCGEAGDCDLADSFIERDHAVFGLDYDLQDDGTTPNLKTTICIRWRDGSVDGVIKKAALDGTLTDFCST